MASAFIPKVPLGKKGVPVYILLIIVVITAAIALYLKKEINKASKITAALEQPQCLTTMKRVWMKGYNYTHPLLIADIEKEADALLPLKGDILQKISDYKTSGDINSAAVYLRKLNDGKWISVNGEENFKRGSQMKVAGLITYMAMAEKDSSILRRKISFTHHEIFSCNQSFAEVSLTEGKDYTVGELLHSMIVRSDNDAASLLYKNIDEKLYRKLFTDLTISSVDFKDPNAEMTAIDYSKFFRLLFNATYLTWERSEYALELLSKSTFNKGLAKELPKDVLVAHKYNECCDGDLKQLHETGIIYFNGDPYLITILTKGKDINKLADVISNISKLVFDKLKVTSQNYLPEPSAQQTASL